MQTPRARRRGPNGEQSPVSAYCTGELDPEERKAFAQLQARNEELRSALGSAGSGPQMPDIDQQVREHIHGLRTAVAENSRLRHELVKVQTQLSEHGMPLVSSTDKQVSGDMGKGYHQTAASTCPSEGEQEELERQSRAIHREIESITESNLALMSKYDEEVKELEQQVADERRRQRMAEVETKLPPSVRSLPPTPPRSSTGLGDNSTPQIANVEESRQLEELKEKRSELRQLEEECFRLQEAIQLELQKREQAKERALQELQLAHEVQREELAHFQQLVEEKRQRGMNSSPQNPGTDPRGLLEAELEQLREHLRDAQQRGEQERAASESHANELRWELQSLREEQRTVAADREATFREIEEVKRASDGRRTPPSTSERPLELQKMHGEALAKEIERTRKRIELLDAKVVQLEDEAKDIRQRANMVLRAVPDRDLGGAPSSPEAAGRIAELQTVVAEREAALQEAKKEESRLQEELATVQKALETANVEARVMEQKMSLLQSRTEI